VTPSEFAEALLHRLGLPASRNNVDALVAFQRIEGGHQANSAQFNPLNTCRDMPGARSAGLKVKCIKAYASWDDGLEATARTMEQTAPGFDMSGIYNSLKRSASPDVTLKAISKSPWGWGGKTVGPASAFSAYADVVYKPVSGAADFFSKEWSAIPSGVKYGALAAVGVLAIGGLVFLGIGLRRRAESA
jgi:hypothetical protein